MKYDIHPIADRVFVKMHPPKSKTAGGIELPEGSQEYQRLGTVVAIGPGQFRAFPKAAPVYASTGDFSLSGDADPSDYLPMRCRIGDLVVVPHHAEKIALDSSKPDEYLAICQECQLLAILTEDE